MRRGLGVVVGVLVLVGAVAGTWLATRGGAPKALPTAAAADIGPGLARPRWRSARGEQAAPAETDPLVTRATLPTGETVVVYPERAVFAAGQKVTFVMEIRDHDGKGVPQRGAINVLVHNDGASVSDQAAFNAAMYTSPGRYLLELQPSPLTTTRGNLSLAIPLAEHGLTQTVDPGQTTMLHAAARVGLPARLGANPVGRPGSASGYDVELAVIRAGTPTDPGFFSARAELVDAGGSLGVASGSTTIEGERGSITLHFARAPGSDPHVVDATLWAAGGELCDYWTSPKVLLTAH